MTIRTVTPVHRPPSLRGVPPRYEVFDRRKSPPMAAGRLYCDPAFGDLVVIEVYDDDFREFLKGPPFAGRRFFWALDVDPDAPHDPRTAIIRPHPMPVPALHGGKSDPSLSLKDAVAGIAAREDYRVIRTSDPV